MDSMRIETQAQIKLRQRIQQREKNLQQLREAVESHKTAVEDSERIFTELICSIERSRSEATQQIRDQEKAAVSQAEGRLKQEINDLRRRDAELEQLLHTHDHLHVLQKEPATKKESCGWTEPGAETGLKSWRESISHWEEQTSVIGG